MCFHSRDEHAEFMQALKHRAPDSAPVVITHPNGEYAGGLFVVDARDKQEIAAVAAALEVWHPNTKIDLTALNEVRQELGERPVNYDGDIAEIEVDKKRIPKSAMDLSLFRKWFERDPAVPAEFALA